MKNFWFFFLFAFSLYSKQHTPAITITYAGNMGVIIEKEGNAVLIDGFHSYYGADYLYPDAQLLTKIRTAYKPHTLLFTHSHGDHFSAELANNYLTLRENLVISGPVQVTDLVTSKKSKIITITTNTYQKQSFKRPSFKISAFKMNHAGTRHKNRQNVAFVVSASDTKILHVGDSDWLEDINLFKIIDIKNINPNIAILPYWMFTGEKAKDQIAKYLPNALLIATHISPQLKETELKSLKDKFPEVLFFTNLEQKIKI